MKEAYYFSHDANARGDQKILSMMTKYAWHGYGLYWALIEIMREQDGYKLAFDKYTYAALAMQLHQDEKQMHDFVSDCINEYKLFKCNDNFIYSNSLLRRMQKKDKISEKRSNAASVRWNKNKDLDANALQKQSISNAIKVKEKKVKEIESKKKIYSEDSNEFRVSLFLFNNILNNNPDFKKPNLQNWATDTDLLLRVDKRNLEEVKKLIVWVQKDDFEKSKVLSISKLRKRYDQLKMEMDQSKVKKSNINQYRKEKTLTELAAEMKGKSFDIELTDYQEVK